MKPSKKPLGQEPRRRRSITEPRPASEHREPGPNGHRFSFKVDFGVDEIAKEIIKLAQEQDSEKK